MKDPIEEALEKMKPAELPDALLARLTAARPQPKPEKERGGIWRRWLLPLATAGCAAALALTVLRQFDDPQEQPTTVAKAEPLPFERNDILLGTRDVGVMVGPNQRPYRVMVVDWLEQDTVRAAVDGPGIRMDTKRRDVVPVALEIF